MLVLVQTLGTGMDGVATSRLTARVEGTAADRCTSVGVNSSPPRLLDGILSPPFSPADLPQHPALSLDSGHASLSSSLHTSITPRREAAGGADGMRRDRAPPIVSVVLSADHHQDEG